MQKAGSRLTPTSRLLSARYLSLSPDWVLQGWRLKLEMFMGGCRSFWGTCWNQTKLLVSAKFLCSHAWGCRTRCLSAFGWVAGQGPTAMTICFEESYALSLPRCQTVISPLFLSLCLQLSPILVFWQKPCSSQACLFWQYHAEFARSPLPACLLGFF